MKRRPRSWGAPSLPQHKWYEGLNLRATFARRPGRPIIGRCLARRRLGHWPDLGMAKACSHRGTIQSSSHTLGTIRIIRSRDAAGDARLDRAGWRSINRARALLRGGQFSAAFHGLRACWRPRSGTADAWLSRSQRKEHLPRPPLFAKRSIGRRLQQIRIAGRRRVVGCGGVHPRPTSASFHSAAACSRRTQTPDVLHGLALRDRLAARLSSRPHLDYMLSKNDPR